MKFFYPIMLLFIVSSSLLLAETEKNITQITLNQAIQKLTQGTQNKILMAETRQIHQQKIYYIKYITEKGRVKRVNIQANTGNFLDQPVVDK
jgi:uncharacterized membrane protein YkoI